MSQIVLWLLAILAIATAVARLRARLLVWTAGAAIALIALTLLGALGTTAGVVLWSLVGAVAISLNVSELRKRLISEPLRHRIARMMPPMSETERAAIEAGTVGWEGQLFAGGPDWRALLTQRVPQLTAAEQAFLDGPVEQLCRMLHSWEITHQRADLPPAVWDFLREQRFFGMIIPAEYGGLGFSAYAHSQVVMKVSSRSPTAGVTVMVPNSLGPAELLLHYGTEAQKDYYLPRLADGSEIPSFALTGPFAGSDAASIPDVGVVCWGEYQGEAVLGLRTSWEKRYITLGPVATVLGLAFQARDPDALLGDEPDLGVTCALIPTDTPGVEIGRRHDPLGTAFQNGPNSGQDVFIPLDWVIGGRAGVGRGWGMLMDCLSAGRGISLPALGCGSGKYCSRLTGAYARVRHQFKRPIGHFEGIEEPLARIAAKTYMMNSARLAILVAIDAGEKPAVASAMVKHFNTEGNRAVVDDAMDVHGGRGICEGPSNYLTIAYRAVPVAITVEGANILTRSMIVFGQGALRCHPYLLDEIKAAQTEDPQQAREDFDAALFPHLGHGVRNAARAFVYGLSRSRLAPAPVRGPSAKYYRRLERLSAAFALIADAALLSLGGGIKRRERLSARFADALIHLYVCSAALKRFEDTGRPIDDLPLLEWSAKYCLYQVQSALDEILRNFPVAPVGIALRWIVFPLGRSYRYPNDRLGHRVARMLLEPSETRDRLTQGIYIDERTDDVTGRMEHALRLAIAAEPLEQRLRKRGFEPPVTMTFADWIIDLVRDGVLDESEAGTLGAWRDALRAAIDVDDFPADLEHRTDGASAAGPHAGASERNDDNAAAPDAERSTPDAVAGGTERPGS